MPPADDAEQLQFAQRSLLNVLASVDMYVAWGATKLCDAVDKIPRRRLLAMQHDPRSEARITPMRLAPVTLNDLPPDYYALIALTFAFLAIVLKVKLYAWITAILCMASLANQRISAIDWQTLFATISLVILTFISTHTPALAQRSSLLQMWTERDAA